MELFKLVGKLAIEGVNEASEQLDGITDKAGKFKSAMGLIGKGALAVTGAVATGTVALVKSVSGAYGELQQSIGGIETLFGDSADKVIENANNAFKTAGLSANDYMQQVTSFSASLLQAVGGDTVKASETANMAIIDMADNANKMGTSIDMIQNAYQGFAKQNYTMLDNLKLGYGGTKTEMERLLKDAEKISGIKYDMSNLNDVYNAIHVIQTELGIAGATADEASDTIQGSFGSLSASWQNFMAGLGNPKADMEQLVEDVANALSGSINNITPIIENLTRVLPTVLDAIIEAVMDMLPTLIDTFTELVLKIIVALIANLPLFISGLVQLLFGLVKGLIAVLPEAMMQLNDAVYNGIQKLNTMIWDAIQPVITAFTETFRNVKNTLVQWGSDILAKGKEIASNFAKTIVNFISNLPSNVMNILNNVISAVVSWASNLITKAKTVASNFTQTVVDGIKSLPDKVKQIGKDLVTGLWDGIKSKITWLKNQITGFGSSIVSKIKSVFDVHSPSRITAEIGGFIAEGLGVGIEDDNTAEKAIAEKARNILDIANGSLSNINIGTSVDGLLADNPMHNYQLDFNAQIGELNDGFERLIALVGQYLPDIAGGMDRNIVLDGNALVVGMSKRMDNQFGKMAIAKGRGNV